ncbi:fasciclin domain-containing protein [Sphingomonas sp. CFBP 8760]|uniref:fasciclin domain-containing protein n=1 Tax=Sphingomonas sp. CFBP 8760 TaxID=2775282 RepID=UPI0017849272|nr:fasciclin domain-containing protein [Sphingomonas sp. CFBP 8760]MBD8545444.1 fasciclin domain-containing protein [Sphingomonas sp. CFBP 8760]
MRSTFLLTAGLMLAPAIATAQTTAPAAPATAPQTAPATGAPTTTAPAGTPQTAPGTAAPATAAAAPVGTGTIVQALPSIPAHATLVRLLTAAKLDAQLGGPGPFTLFAPNDEAFSRLPAGTLDTLLAPANVASLTTILKNHVVSGALTSDQIKSQITAGGGRATLTTLSGQPLVATIDNGSILLTDAVGNKSYVDKPADVREANGVIHSTNGISLPKLG